MSHPAQTEGRGSEANGDGVGPSSVQGGPRGGAPLCPAKHPRHGIERLFEMSCSTDATYPNREPSVAAFIQLLNTVIDAGVSSIGCRTRIRPSRATS
jgi:hypothetical protein